MNKYAKKREERLIQLRKYLMLGQHNIDYFREVMAEYSAEIRAIEAKQQELGEITEYPEVK